MSNPNAPGQSLGTYIGAGVGFVVGSFLGAPLLGAQIGALAGGLAGALYDTVNPPENVQEQDSIADLTLQTSAYGQPIPLIAGVRRVSGNVIDIGPKTEHQHKESSGGGKGGGPRNITITKTYTVSLCILLADTRVFGEIAGVARIYADDTLIWDINQEPQLPDGWTFYSGSATQAPDPVFEAIHGVGNVPGYIYRAFMVAEDYDLGTNPRVPNFSFEIFQDGALGARTAPRQLAVMLAAGDVFVTVPGLGQVWRYSQSTAAKTAEIQLGTVDDPYIFPTAYGLPIAFENDDYFWVADPTRYTLWRVATATNTVDTSIELTESLVGNMVWDGINGVMWVAVMNYEEYLSTSEWKMRLIGFNSSGVVINPGYIGEAWENAPIRIAFDNDGELWTFSNRGTDDGDDSEVLRIDHTDGSVLATVNLTPNSKPLDVVYTVADDKIWVVEYTTNALVKIDVQTQVIDETIPVCSGPIQALVADDGFIWIVGDAGEITRLDPSDSSTVTYGCDLAFATSPGDNILSRASSTPGGAIWLACTEGWTIQRFEADGTVTTVRAGERPQSLAFATGILDDVWVTCSNGLYRVTQDGSARPLFTPPANVASQLPQVVSALCDAAGLDASQYDVSDLPGEPVSLAIVSVVAIRSPLEQLAIAYNFQLIDRGLTLVFQRYGQEAIRATIPEDDLLLPEQEGGDVPGGVIVRTEDLALPTNLNFKYIATRRNYQDGAQNAWVTTQQNPARNERVITTYAGLLDIIAKQRAQEYLDRLWIEREEFTFELGRKYAHLEPGDRIVLAIRGVEYGVLLSNRQYGKPGRVKFVGREDSSFTQYVLGAKPGVANPGKQYMGYLRHTTARLLNLPALTSNDQGIRYHVAYEYQAAGYPGATLHRSPDGGSTYNFVHAGILQASSGIVATPLADANWYILDEVNTFTVAVPYGTLVSITDDELWAGGNMSQIGDEMVCFGLADLIAPGVWECSRLIRGVRGTEWAVGTHGSNEVFVLLDQAVYAIEHGLSERNAEASFKCVTNGAAISNVTAQLFTPTDENLLPWEIFLDGTRDTGSGDWALTALQRSRFYGDDWLSGAGIGFDTDLLGWRLDVYDNTFTTVLRTFDIARGTDPEASITQAYTAAQQTTDYGSPQTTIYLKAYGVGSGGLSHTRETTLVG